MNFFESHAKLLLTPTASDVMLTHMRRKRHGRGADVTAVTYSLSQLAGAWPSDVTDNDGQLRKDKEIKDGSHGLRSLRACLHVTVDLLNDVSRVSANGAKS